MSKRQKTEHPGIVVLRKFFTPEAIAAGLKYRNESSGIFLRQTTPNNHVAQPYECYCCGREIKGERVEFLIDRETLEVLPPDDHSQLGAYWPIGPECRKKYPGIKRFKRVHLHNGVHHMASIPGCKIKHAIITDRCRENHGDDGAIEEVMRRFFDEWPRIVKAWPRGAGTKLHVVITIEDAPPGPPEPPRSKKPRGYA